MVCEVIQYYDHGTSRNLSLFQNLIPEMSINGKQCFLFNTNVKFIASTSLTLTVYHVHAAEISTAVPKLAPPKSPNRRGGQHKKGAP